MQHFLITVPHAVAKEDPQHPCPFQHTGDYTAVPASEAIEKELVTRGFKPVRILAAENRCVSDSNRKESRSKRSVRGAISKKMETVRVPSLREKLDRELRKHGENAFVFDTHSFPKSGKNMPEETDPWYENGVHVAIMHFRETKALAESVMTKIKQRGLKTHTLMLSPYEDVDIIKRASEMGSKGLLFEFWEGLSVHETRRVARKVAASVVEALEEASASTAAKALLASTKRSKSKKSSARAKPKSSSARKRRPKRATGRGRRRRS